jgi:hypothetical protein
MLSRLELPAEEPRQAVEFAAAFVWVYEKHIITQFKSDGSVSDFWPPLHKRDFAFAAIEMGYPLDNCGIMQYGIEHDLTHHWLAGAMGWPYSFSIWSAAHSKEGNSELPMDRWSQRIKDEEHLVNRMQRYINTGQKDDDYGCLDRAFGDTLPSKAGDLIFLLRPWLKR